MSASTQWQLAREAAERYETILVPAILGPFAQALVEWAELKPGEAVVDIGCGTGAAARYAAEAVGKSGRVVGVDVNGGMLAVASSIPARDGAAIEWREGNAYQLFLEDESMDVALCAQTLQFFSDRPKALQEIRRILRPEGRAVISLWCELEESPYFHALVEAVERHIGAETAVGLRSAFGLTDRDEINKLLFEAGFGDVTMTVGQLDLRLPVLNEFIPRHVSATPMAAGFAGALPEVQQAVVGEVVGWLEAYALEDGGVQVPFRAYLIRARG